WVKELDVNRLAEELDRSAAAVRKAVRTLIASGSQTKMHYDHPLLFLQHIIWHEGYHHGQIKLALKAGGPAFDDEVIGRITWDVWMDKHTF
ncbi:MAG: damage-inducible protein DinB, partial [Acidobacteriaceae bacterium]|nr:damage-inducible protein DinB [Acidobacteriaceae bacterium]